MMNDVSKRLKNKSYMPEEKSSQDKIELLKEDIGGRSKVPTGFGGLALGLTLSVRDMGNFNKINSC